ncbi:MAG: peptidase S10 [Myxococcales bacterium]|nr:peptidase S10 [Myxococcales bacterium]
MSTESRPTDAPKPAAPTEDTVVTRHRTVIDGTTYAYTATAGTLNLRDESGAVSARLFYVAFTLDGVRDPSTRPLTFAFNGGPGSSSVWLQLGALGPRRVDMPDTAVPHPPPYRLVDNAFGLLDQTDLVFIDPVDTGFSRPHATDKRDAFYTIAGDVDAVAEFIWRYLSRHHRWNSPRFLAGESYGTTRAAALARVLQDRGIVLNGLVLLSLALNFQTFVFDVGNELPYIFFLPSYAATAWYHDRLPDKPPDLGAFLAEVRDFAIEEYAPALFRGAALDPDRRDAIAARIARYTGLDKADVLRLDLRVEYLRFAKTVLDRPGYTVGRLDSRYVGPDLDPDARRQQRDPSYDAPLGPFSALINDYLRRVLCYEADEGYEVLSMRVNEAWDWSDKRRMGPPNVGEDLRHALIANPHLRVVILSGLFDLATPFFAAEYTADHLGVEPALRAQIEIKEYAAGHMMYFHPPSLAAMRRDLVAFYRASVRTD